ncbi:MAG TPA: hypothetical protein VMF04_02070 [Thermoplasmata archaeon]|nr:hypothetical protein [Thermoplasmata archaeon]
MAARLAALCVTAILIVMTLMAIAPSGSHGAPTGALAPAVRPDLPVIGVTPTDIYGDTEYTFYPGTTESQVYFVVGDPADDANVTVHIFDSNATRDGLTNPVATWVVNVSSGFYSSPLYGIAYTIPSSVVYGGTWNITASGAVGGNVSTAFTVQTYTLWAHASPVLLPNAMGWVTYFVNASAGGGPYSHVSSVNVSAVYLDGTTGHYAPLNLSQNSWGAGTASATATFTMPLNASEYGWVFFNVWANVSSDGNFSLHFNTSGEFSTAIANYYATDIYPECACVGDLVTPNQQVYVEAVPWMWSEGYGYQYAPGVTMYVSFYGLNGVIPASAVPGNPPSTLVSGAIGYTEFSFIASPSVFSTTALNYLNISVVALPSVNGSAIVWDNYSEAFALAPTGTSLVGIFGAYSAADYYAGQTATFNWSLSALSGGTLTGWAGQGYSVTAWDYGDTVPISIASGYLTGTSGTITFTVPAAFDGDIWTAISAQNGSFRIQQTFETSADYASIDLRASVSQFTPGQSFTVTVENEGPGFAGATEFFAVYPEDSDSAPIASGTISGTSFTVLVPGPIAPSEVEIEAWAQSNTSGIFAYGDTDLDEASLLNVQVGISTTSLYSDGSFQPGQTITVTWSAAASGAGAGTNSRWYVALWNTNGWDYEAPPLQTVVTSNMSGSFSYTIPSGTPAGQQTLFVSVGAYNDCEYRSCYGASSVSYSVNPSPSALNYELGAGSGLTVGWLILLLLIVIVAIVLVLMIRRGRSPKSPTSTYTATQPMSPPAPAPTTAPAAEWKEGSGAPASDAPAPASSGDGQPPLPTPPSGAQ